jgi:tetratricopeptide (TPR) repeat protein
LRIFIIVRINMHSRMLHFAAAAATACALIAAAPTWADDSGRRPAYLQALSDLRDARQHLEHFGNEPAAHEAERAIFEIDRAINEIKQAAAMNGGDAESRVPGDTHLVRNGRFHKAMELLDRARRHLAGEEVEPDAQALLLRVLHHIEEAQHEVARAMAIVNETG